MRTILRLLGWTVVGEMPKSKKNVFIFAPHTSNWDFVIMMMTRFSFKMKPAYLGKDTLFRPPFGWFFRMLGGIPVVRSNSHNVVDQVVKIIHERDEIALALAPEGTRSRTKYWKSGFYHIALKAEVPIVMAFLDTKTKTLGMTDAFNLTGDQSVDMEVIRNFYKDKTGFKPELTSDIVLGNKEINKKKDEPQSNLESKDASEVDNK